MVDSSANAPTSSLSSSSMLTGPDNRCCFCLTLRIGTVIVAIANLLVNVLGFGWYLYTTHLYSDWLHASVMSMFVLQIVVDHILLYGAIKKLPSHAVPWLWANSGIMAILLIVVSLMLFFGYVHMSLTYGEYVSVLSAMGVLSALHLFSCMVVFQFRKNLIEERRIYDAIARCEQAEAPQTILRSSSPPPAYEEVSKITPGISYEQKSGFDMKSGQVDGNDHGRNVVMEQPPPEYETAVAGQLPSAPPVDTQDK